MGVSEEVKESQGGDPVQDDSKAEETPKENQVLPFISLSLLKLISVGHKCAGR